jgi:hypothetical protein
MDELEQTTHLTDRLYGNATASIVQPSAEPTLKLAGDDVQNIAAATARRTVELQSRTNSR